MARYDVLADYHQFYLMDEEKQPDIPEEVTDEDMERRLQVAPHIVVVHAASNATVPVTLDVRAHEEQEDLERWQHVVEFSLELPSGRAVLAGCTDYLPDCPRVEMLPGTYRGRAYFQGLDGNSAEAYRIALWPGKLASPLVVKAYADSAS